MKIVITNYPKKIANALLIGFLFVGFVFNSCQKNEKTSESLEKKGNLLINSDQSVLNSRVSLTNKIMLVEPISSTNKKSLNEAPKIDLNKNYVFTLRAEVAPPVYKGNTLQATHVKIYDNYAFVTYNTKGSTYLGGIDIFEISDIDHPVIIKNLTFPNADVSSVDYYNRKLYLVGAIKIDSANQYPHMQNPSMLEVISLNSAFDVVKIDTIIDLGAFVGTDIRVTADNIFATSGTSGYIKAFDHSYQEIYSKQVQDARAVEANNSKVFVLDANPAQINIYNRINASESGSFAVWNEALQNEAKSELAVSDKYIFAALNFGGMKMLNIDGSLKSWTPKPPTPEGKLDENYVTNSVSLNGDLVLFSNGEAGLYLGGIIKSRGDSLAILGRIRFNEGQSVNHVESRDSVIFVATGTGGLKILSVSIDEGVPDDIIITPPCSTLVDSIIGLFPENENNFNKFPSLFNGTWTKQIKLIEKSEVYLTFLWEGAGWKNSFGYYTYNENNPPTSVDDITKTLLFPNVSMKNEGGGLESGWTLQLGTGTFPAGTVIGFYLVIEGWNYGLPTDGKYIHYTNNQFNIGGHQQHVLFKEKNCNDLVMIFEDITLDDPGNDKDFNDIMFVISDSNDPAKANTKFDLTNVKEF